MDFGMERYRGDETWRERYYWRWRYTKDFGWSELPRKMTWKEYYYVTKNKKIFTDLKAIREGVDEMLGELERFRNENIQYEYELITKSKDEISGYILELLYTTYEDAVYLTGDDDVLMIYDNVDKFKTSTTGLRRIGYRVSKFMGDIVDQDRDSEYYDILETDIANMINPLYVDFSMEDNVEIEYVDDSVEEIED